MVILGGLSLPSRVRQIEAAHSGHQAIHASRAPVRSWDNNLQGPGNCFAAGKCSRQRGLQAQYLPTFRLVTESPDMLSMSMYVLNSSLHTRPQSQDRRRRRAQPARRRFLGVLPVDAAVGVGVDLHKEALNLLIWIRDDRRCQGQRLLLHGRDTAPARGESIGGMRAESGARAERRPLFEPSLLRMDPNASMNSCRSRLPPPSVSARSKRSLSERIWAMEIEPSPASWGSSSFLPAGRARGGAAGRRGGGKAGRQRVWAAVPDSEQGTTGWQRRRAAPAQGEQGRRRTPGRAGHAQALAQVRRGGVLVHRLGAQRAPLPLRHAARRGARAAGSLTLPRAPVPCRPACGKRSKCQNSSGS